MRVYYDDNFGRWDIEDDEDVVLYHQFQQRNVEKTCAGCGRSVMLQPHYDICDTCATKREQGWDI